MPPGDVTITNREIYDAVLRLAAAVDSLSSDYAGAAQRIGDHEMRLRQIERRRWPLPAVAVLLSLLAVVLAAAQIGMS